MLRFIPKIAIPKYEYPYQPKECPPPPSAAATNKPESSNPKKKLLLNKEGIPRAPDLFFGDCDQARRLPPVPSLEEMGIKWTILQQEKKNKLSQSAMTKVGGSGKRKSRLMSKRGSVLDTIGLMARKSKINMADVAAAVSQHAVPQQLTKAKTEFMKKH